MNELEQQLSKVLEKSLEVAERTGEFVIDQAPELLQEFYMWHTAKHSLSAILFTIFAIICGYMFYRFIKSDKWGTVNDEGVVIGSVISATVGIMCAIAIMIDIYTLVFIHVAPKLYLIEYFLR